MRWFIASLLIVVVSAGSWCLYKNYRAAQPWVQWNQFVQRYVQADGRVVDVTAGNRSTSEGQSYGLFFALVANDRDAFERILAWTEQNLSGGDLSLNLPAWLWGQDENQQWGILDQNPASDSDLWIAYSLLEAARLWEIPKYEKLARSILGLIASRELVYLEQRGYMLLPAPRGFLLDSGHWRFNPSYSPPFLMARLATADPAGPWGGLANTAQELIFSASPNGIAPDWFEYKNGVGVLPDSVKAPVSSYDAIRVYLWAGMLSKDAPEHAVWMKHFAQMATLITEKGAPEYVDVYSLQAKGHQAAGFSAALLPFIAALGEDTQLNQQKNLVAEHTVNGFLGEQAHYYDQVLALFGVGFIEDHYRFDAKGQLEPRWTKTCCEFAGF